MSGRAAVGARVPNAKVSADRPTMTGGFGKALMLLRSTEQITEFFSELVEALKELEPAEPDNKLFVARLDGALARWERLSESEAPTAADIEALFESVLGAAIATQAAEEKAPPAAAGASARAFDPRLIASNAYGRRRRAEK